MKFFSILYDALSFLWKRHIPSMSTMSMFTIRDMHWRQWKRFRGFGGERFREFLLRTNGLTKAFQEVLTDLKSLKANFTESISIACHCHCFLSVKIFWPLFNADGNFIPLIFKYVLLAITELERKKIVKKCKKHLEWSSANRTVQTAAQSSKGLH